MNKVLLIIQREYLTRVKKKSFLLMTFLVPALIIAMYALIAYLSVNGADKATEVHVYDDSGIFTSEFKNTETVSFSAGKTSFAAAKKEAATNEDGFILHIPKDIEQLSKVELYSKKKVGLSALSTINAQLEEILRNKQLKDAGIDAKTLATIKPDISIDSKELTAEGEKDSSAGAAYAIGFAAAILIYMSLFIYGSQVMRGVIEEKTSRIVEVVISSVKPFQLMMGKIIGIGLVGLTQFTLWIVLSTTLVGTAGKILLKDNPTSVKTEQVEGKQNKAIAEASNNPALTVINAVKTLNLPYIFACFLVYFLGGYLIYSALFAAVGSAVDNETETQQFMLPITLPLLFTYIMSFSFIINNPDSSLSFWLSIIPFTSPIAMMVRLPFGVPDWQLALSMFLLIGGFILTTWIAAKIYRVGILMYGKKASYKELAKWLFYKE
ncbi:MAG: ABC transporter permease [Sphingobacteriales bacterium]|nr:ABC transporter permease [Sphingobacteriales bacterium]